MATFAAYSPPVNSTAGQATDPSTSDIVAELDSTQLHTVNHTQLYDVKVWLGCSTVGDFVLEHCLSTGLGSTAIRETTFLRVSPNLTPQYVKRFSLERGDRIRVRVATAITGSQTAEAKLSAEALG